MGPSQICGCPFREPRVFEIAHIYIYIFNSRKPKLYVRLRYHYISFFSKSSSGEMMSTYST